MRRNSAFLFSITLWLGTSPLQPLPGSPFPRRTLSRGETGRRPESRRGGFMKKLFTCLLALLLVPAFAANQNNKPKPNAAPASARQAKPAQAARPASTPARQAKPAASPARPAPSTTPTSPRTNPVAPRSGASSVRPNSTATPSSGAITGTKPTPTALLAAGSPARSPLRGTSAAGSPAQTHWHFGSGITGTKPTTTGTSGGGITGTKPTTDEHFWQRRHRYQAHQHSGSGITDPNPPWHFWQRRDHRRQTRYHGHFGQRDHGSKIPPQLAL